MAILELECVNGYSPVEGDERPKKRRLSIDERIGMVENYILEALNDLPTLPQSARKIDSDKNSTTIETVFNLEGVEYTVYQYADTGRESLHVWRREPKGTEKERTSFIALDQRGVEGDRGKASLVVSYKGRGGRRNVLRGMNRGVPTIQDRIECAAPELFAARSETRKEATVHPFSVPFGSKRHARNDAF